MPDKCCVFNCRSGYDNDLKETVFFFPDEKKDYDLRQRWIRFVNREGWKPSKKSCICRKHFEPHYYKTGAKGKRYRLIKKLKPVPTIFDREESHLSAEPRYLKSPISVPRKSPTKRVFRVRAIVSDNHAANVLAYKLLLKEFGHLDDNLSIEHDYQKIYWVHYAVHLIKNVRNNLLNYKRFIFPAFEYDDFEDPISFKVGQISWKLFHDVFEKDSLLEANLRKAPNITHKVLHPGNCKQNVPVAFGYY